MHIVFLQNWPSEDMGRLRAILVANNVDLTIVEAYRIPTPSNNPIYPNLANVDGIIIGGTPISISILNDALWTEKQYIIQAISHHRPILGICGGCQLLVKLLGAEIHLNPVPEVGITEIFLSQEGKHHALFTGFPPTFHAFQWHEETYTLPPGGIQLATTPTCKQQACGCSICFGIQFHLETRPEDITQWTTEFLTSTQEDQILQRHLIAQSHEFEAELEHLAKLLMKNFLSIIIADKRAN